MQDFNDWLVRLKAYDIELFSIGDAQITVSSVLLTLLLVVMLFFVAGRSKVLVAQRLLRHSHLDLGTREVMGTITRYMVLVVGFLIIMQTAGINLTTFHVLAGAVGVGVGFGLQNIVNNFISGLIVLFERPIKIGDRIAVGDIEGDVMEIGARRTTVMGSDKVVIIVPNAKFITENVKNWNYATTGCQLRITIDVAQESDPRLCERLLLEAAREHKEVASDPPPTVHLTAVKATAFSFQLLVWGNVGGERRSQLLTELNLAIYERLHANQIKLA